MRHPVAAICWVLLALLAPAPSARAATPPSPFLVADLNHLPVESDGLPLPNADSSAVGMRPVAMAGVLYFAAADPAHGQELWRSDGTAAGTWRVNDIRPGPMGSSPTSLTVFQGRLYFAADDGVRGWEPWSSDGTAAGTRPLADLCPGPCSSLTFGLSSMAPTGDRLFFTAATHGLAPNLWVTDGTREGTQEVPGTGAQSVYGLFPLAQGVVLYPAAGAVGNDLWRSDGTAQGTYRLKSSDGSPTGAIYGVSPLRDGAVFWTYDAFWRTDGTAAGTVRLKQGAGPADAPALLLVDNDLLYFVNGRNELWVTDGTPLGTTLLTGGFPRTRDLSPNRLTASPCGPLFFAGDSQSKIRLWRVHGPAGPVEAISPPLGTSTLLLTAPWSADGRAFYAVPDFAARTADLWELDAGTCQPRRVTQLCGPARACAYSAPYLTAAAGDTGFFALSTQAEGAELWRSDGTEAGTFLVRDIGRDPGSTGVAELAPLGNQVLFPARLGAGPAGLWKSDGSAAGTRVVKGVPWPQGLTAASGFLYFTAGSPDAGCRDSQPACRGLWRTDGTRAGTRLLKPDVFSAQARGVDGGRLFFAASGSTDFFHGTGIEPWVSDGTAAGTHLLADLNQRLYNNGFGGLPYVGSSSPGTAVRTGPSLLFAADDGISGRELWATDLTAGGTRLVSDIDPRGQGTNFPADSSPGPLVPLGGISLFAASEETHGRELWASDGTAAGTRLVADLLPGTGSSSPHDLTLLGGRVWFLAADPQNAGGEALWASDGTAAGTRLVAPLSDSGSPALARSLTAAGSRLFFVVDGETVGSELWTSDGTTAGTRLVADLRPGPVGSYPQGLTAIDGRLVFAADDGASGLEPWVSDGTAAGTRRLGDLAPGADASSPGPFVAAGSYVFFGAWDPVHGRELWAVPRSALTAP